MSHMEFKCKKGKDNILADSLSTLKTLGLYETSAHEKEGMSVINISSFRTRGSM